LAVDLQISTPIDNSVADPGLKFFIFSEQMEKPFGAHVFWLKEKEKEVPYAFLPVSVPEESTLLFNMSIRVGGSGSPHHLPDPDPL
jgi:hypothetical protein